MRSAELLKKRKFAEYVMKTLLRSYSKGTHTLLINRNPTETLVAAMLSPQCTDKQVNNATRLLFRRFKSISDYAYAKPSTLRKYLKGVNYYKTKAMNIKRAAQIIERDYNGKIPDSIEELVKLPGVGRKVANVIMNEGFGRAEGIAIDTHCITVSNRLGLARNKDPLKIERALMEELPRKYWGVASNLLIALGRDTCKARKKECYRCVLRKACPSSSAP